MLCPPAAALRLQQSGGSALPAIEAVNADYPAQCLAARRLAEEHFAARAVTGRFIRSVFQELVEPLGVALRGDGRVNHVGGFYAQWEWGVTDLDKVSVVFFCRLLEEELRPGWNEISCHPGLPSPDFRSVYGEERVREVSTLTEPRLVPTLRALGIRLTSYAAPSQPAPPGARTVVPLPRGNGTSPRPGRG